MWLTPASSTKTVRPAIRLNADNGPKRSNIHFSYPCRYHKDHPCLLIIKI